MSASAKDRVLDIYNPQANIRRYSKLGITTHYIVWSNPFASGSRLGSGKTSTEAWKKALKTFQDRDEGVHLSHCNQGEYEGSCKYGQDSTCPALKTAKKVTKATTVSGPHQFITQLQVQMNNKKKRWIITRCDEDSGIVGTCTACGVPARAEALPVGTTFQTTLTIPE